MNANQKALELSSQLIKLFEGFSSKPYLCPAGIPTQGYGTVYKPDHTVVKITDSPITKETAEMWLLSEIENNYMKSALSLSPVLAQYPNSLAAITSFCYNLGVPRYRASTLRRLVNTKQWEQAKVSILLWSRAAGRILPGLLKRRQIESKFLGT